MRTFVDEHGRAWVAAVRERTGPDYKGRFYFQLIPEDADESQAVQLLDVRWNSEQTASQTLETMSEVELRRRLGQALGRRSKAVTSLGSNGAR